MPAPFETPQILYEDNHLLVAAKPPGIPSQSGRSSLPDMAGLLKRDLALRHEKPGNVFLGLVHRLDQPVSGLMVFAKTSKAASRLSQSFRTRQVQKLYLGIVRGIPDVDEGVMCDVLSRREIDGRVRRVKDHEGYVAELNWRLLSRDRGRGEALLLINLITGRRHQIRAQMAEHGLPLLGDRRYGLMDDRDQAVPTVALHACCLTFAHPVKKESLSFRLGPAINPSFSAKDAETFETYLP
ncbi:MAG: RNA pseudouridine synthase [Clostridiaceae bacterium]|nr:RNA pseudouridine synthase [Clostridiaceae bacterium]